MKKTVIPYFPDSSLAYGHLAERSGFVFLDSGYPNTQSGRYDILAAEPMITLSTRGRVTDCQQGDKHWQTGDDPFDVLKRYLGETVDPTPATDDLPFVGGALGYFSYDLGRWVEEMPSIAEDDVKLPQMLMGIYDWAVVVDHLEQKSWLIGQGRDPATLENWASLVASVSQPREKHVSAPFKVTSQILSNLDKPAYAKAFARIKHYINEGDCYQVNLAQRFSAQVEGDSWDAYCRLRQQNPAPFAAYMVCGDGAILSSSPERFLLIKQGGDVETKPIKGTRPRDADPVLDQALAEELRQSTKDQAENVMIVDLLRNDIGKNCAIGSVSVPKLFDIESYKTVHHLVSTVTGKLADDKHVLDLLRGAFPGGSITGAPKLRSMEIIEELEPHRRSLYCGSVGYISFDGKTDTNIAIRTMLWDQGQIHVAAGGGIVMDSEMESEYQETYDKASAMLTVLENAQQLNNKEG